LADYWRNLTIFVEKFLVFSQGILAEFEKEFLDFIADGLNNYQAMFLHAVELVCLIFSFSDKWMNGGNTYACMQ
jgi:hypothetical protein